MNWSWLALIRRWCQALDGFETQTYLLTFAVVYVCSYYRCIDDVKRNVYWEFIEMTNGRISKMMIGIAAVGALAVASSAWAGPHELQVHDNDAWGQIASGDNRGGGPFEAQPFGYDSVQGLGMYGAGADNYLTFCIERNETLGIFTFDAHINDEAINGGFGGGNPDPLDARTAFLFTAFMRGTLDDKLADAGLSAFTYENGDSGIAFQEAVWVIEQELGSTLVSSVLATDLLTLADAAVGVGGEWENMGIGNVRILNLTLDGEDRQDVLIMVPLPIPVLLGLAGLAGVGVMTRRRRKMA